MFSPKKEGEIQPRNNIKIKLEVLNWLNQLPIAAGVEQEDLKLKKIMQKMLHNRLDNLYVINTKKSGDRTYKL